MFHPKFNRFFNLFILFALLASALTVTPATASPVKRAEIAVGGATISFAGLTTRVFVASEGTQGNDRSSHPSISADGRYVAFSSDASNLVTDDTNGTGDVFVYDRHVDDTVRVTISSENTQGNGWSDFPSISSLVAGDLDLDFGNNGKVQTVIGNFGSATSVQIQDDGKIVVAGYSNNNITNNDFTLARYTIDGSLDTSFGVDGIVTTDFGGYDAIWDIVIQPDEKIIAVGGSILGASSGFMLARYNSDGTLDNTFGVNGKSTTSFNYGATARSVFLLEDGKIMVAGTSFNGQTNDFSLIKYNSDGSLDMTFGVYGKAITDFGYNDAVAGMAIQSDGKILLAGSSGECEYDFALARYNIDGSLDSSFGLDGKVSSPKHPVYGLDPLSSCVVTGNSLRSVLIQDDGKILAIGTSSVGSGNSDIILLRYMSNGTLDASFGVNGTVILDVNGHDDSGSDIIIQPNRKIIAFGTASGVDFLLARYNNNGTLDTEFGIDGIVRTDIHRVDEARAIMSQPEGKILAVGSFNLSLGFAIVRYISIQTFPDVPTNYWAWAYVERLYNAGLTGGYPDGTYRPANTVTRAEMAIFLMKGMNGPAYTPPTVSPTFTDTDSHWAANWIEALKTAGLTGGYPDGTYRPNSPVTRAEMAIFLLKAMNGAAYTPPSASPTFSDTAEHWAADWIEALKAAGITSGYPDGTYRPGNYVTRAEMAVFLVKAFGLP